jgi:hypothetical protein
VKFKSSLITQASGSVGGATFSHNRGGMYVRSRATPTNPGSAFQQVIRGFVAALTSAWNDTLTPAQRAAWDTYAENVPMTDSLGEPRNIGGLGHYVRSNVPRLQAALPRVDDGPTVYNLGEFTNPAFGTISAGGGTAGVTFDNADDWANEDDAAMLVLLSRGQNPGVNYFKGPYRFADLIAGDSVTPPTSPDSITAPFALAEGQKLFGQVRVSRADGRLSLPFRLVGTCAA